MASPCASAPSSSRYAIASAVTAGCRRVKPSASRCARSLDHDAIAFQVSTSLGRSVMAVHALVAARRCAAREDAPPPVLRRRRLAKDEVLAGYPDLERQDIQEALRYAAWLAQE